MPKLIRAFAASAALFLCCATHAWAQSAEAVTQPPRYLAMLSIGEPLKLNASSDFGQRTLGPAFSDALVGYVFASKARLRHGFGLGLSTNLARDGGYTQPVNVFDQIALMPSYLLFVDLGAELFGVAHAGIPILVRGGGNVGAEAAFAFGYRLLSGVGAFAEAGLDAFGGARSRVNASLSLELGLFLDYEVLP